MFIWPNSTCDNVNVIPLIRIINNKNKTRFWRLKLGAFPALNRYVAGHARVWCTWRVHTHSQVVQARATAHGRVTGSKTILMGEFVMKLCILHSHIQLSNDFYFFGTRLPECPFWVSRKSYFFWTSDIWTSPFWAVNTIGLPYARHTSY